MKTTFALAVAAAVLLPLSAQAQTKQQTNFIETVSVLMYSETRCPNLRVNIGFIFTTSQALKIEPGALSEGGRFFEAMNDNIRATKAQFSSTSQSSFCNSIEDGFGPEGVIIPNAMKKR